MFDTITLIMLMVEPIVIAYLLYRLLDCQKKAALSKTLQKRWLSKQEANPYSVGTISKRESRVVQENILFRRLLAMILAGLYASQRDVYGRLMEHMQRDLQAARVPLPHKHDKEK